MVRITGEILGFNHVFGIGQEIHDFQRVILHRLHPRGSIGQGLPQSLPELDQAFRFLLPDFYFGNEQEIKISDPASGVGQFKPVFVFVKLTAFHVAFGIVGILEIIEIKGFKFFQILTGDQPIQLQPLSSRGQIVNEPDKISIANGDFKPAPWGQQRRRLGNHGFQLDHFVNVFISQHRETVLVELHRLGHALFNPGMKGRPQNQGIGGVSVRDRA